MYLSGSRWAGVTHTEVLGVRRDRTLGVVCVHAHMHKRRLLVALQLDALGVERIDCGCAGVRRSSLGGRVEANVGESHVVDEKVDDVGERRECHGYGGYEGKGQPCDEGAYAAHCWEPLSVVVSLAV